MSGRNRDTCVMLFLLPKDLNYRHKSLKKNHSFDCIVYLARYLHTYNFITLEAEQDCHDSETSQGCTVNFRLAQTTNVTISTIIIPIYLLVNYLNNLPKVKISFKSKFGPCSGRWTVWIFNPSTEKVEAGGSLSF